MQKLSSNHSTSRALSALRFLQIRLTSRPETRSLNESIEQARQRLAVTHEAVLEAKEQRQAATAEIEYNDGLVNASVLDISRRVLAEVGGDRDAPAFKRLFSDPPSTIVRPVGGESQERAVRGMLAAIAGHEADYAHIAAEAEGLKRRLDTLDAAEAARSGLYIAEGRAIAERNIALDNARDAYNGAFHHLMIALPGNETLVESFFKALRNPTDTTDTP